MGYAAIQAFYPNMSKFMQQNYGITNSHAGMLSSIPYIVASVLVPIQGHLLSYFGQTYYEKFLAFAMSLILVAHFMFLALFEFVVDGKIQKQWTIIVPILFIGFGHSMMATLQGPIVNKLCEDKSMIPLIFSKMKIFEGISISVMMYSTGLVRQKTGSYTGVSLLLIATAAVSIFFAVYLDNLAKEKAKSKYSLLSNEKKSEPINIELLSDLDETQVSD